MIETDWRWSSNTLNYNSRAWNIRLTLVSNHEMKLLQLYSGCSLCHLVVTVMRIKWLHSEEYIH